MAVVDVWPRATRLALEETAKSCATPSETAVSNPIETRTSTRLKPPLLELHFADAIDRHRLGSSVPRYRERDRRIDRLRHAAHHVHCRSVRTELNHRAADPRPIGQRADRTIEVR